MSWIRFREINNILNIYQDCSLNSLRHHQKEAKLFLDKPHSLILQGDFGTGKTFFMMTLIRELFEKSKWPLWAIYFSRAKTLSDKMEEEFRQYGTTKAMVDKVVEANCVFIDDFGVQAKGDRMERDFYEIVDVRMGNMLPTIFSTNLSDDELKQILGGRIYSRLKVCERIIFTGEDQRSFY